MSAAKDTDTWDISFPYTSDDDIILWNSFRFSEEVPEDDLQNEFLAAIRSGSFRPKGITVLSKDELKETDTLIELFYDEWYSRWFLDGYRWTAMRRSLEAVMDVFDDTSECLPSGLVLYLKRGWAPKGIGHSYGLIRCASVGRLLQKLKEGVIPKEISDDEELTVLLPKGGTLSLQYLKGPCYTAAGEQEETEDGALIYEYGTSIEFYYVNPEAAKVFITWLNNLDALNSFCDTYVEKLGMTKLISTYLEPINNIVEHVWRGSTLEPKWDIKNFRKS